MVVKNGSVLTFSILYCIYHISYQKERFPSDATIFLLYIAYCICSRLLYVFASIVCVRAYCIRLDFDSSKFGV